MSIGLVDEVVNADEVVSRAIEWLREQFKSPQLAMLGTRQIARRDLVRIFEYPENLELDDFADSWFGSETQTTLKALVAKLKK